MTDPPDPTRSKVGRLLEQYELDGVGQELEDRWVGNGGESESLRAIADWFNRQLLRRKMERVGMSPLDGEVANVYRLLSDGDDVTSGARVEAETTLADNGIDPSRTEDEFVSHQAVHTYLTKFRGASKERESTDRIATVRETFQKLRNRLVTVIEHNLEQLRQSQRITLGNFNVLLDVQVFCEDCGASYSLSKLFEHGGCDCDPDT